jgi:hypothetical protein
MATDAHVTTETCDRRTASPAKMSWEDGKERGMPAPPSRKEMARAPREDGCYSVRRPTQAKMRLDSPLRTECPEIRPNHIFACVDRD